MKFTWDLEKEKIIGEDEDYIGNMRIGTICFDIIIREAILNFDCYVGGIGDYGYSTKVGFENYPYEEYGGFDIEKDYTKMSLEDIKQEAERLAEEFIIESHLTNEAKKELILW